MERVRRANLLRIVLPLSFVYLFMSLSLASGAETVLRFAGHHPINHHCTRGMDLYAKLVTEKTNKVKIEVYPASQLHRS